MESSKQVGLYRFGPYTVNLAIHQLLCESTSETMPTALPVTVPVTIQEQPFQILIALLERPGELVTREELRVRLWGKETFVDFDQSMNSAIRRLRVALSDSPKNPLYIETAPRIGFRFIAPVEVVHRHPDPVPRHSSPIQLVRATIADWKQQVSASAWSNRLPGPVVWAAPLIACTIAIFPILNLYHSTDHARQPRLAAEAITSPARSTPLPTLPLALESPQTYEASDPRDIQKSELIAPTSATPLAKAAFDETHSLQPATQPSPGMSPSEAALIRSRFLLSRRNTESYHRAEALLKQAMGNDPLAAPLNPHPDETRSALLLAQYGELQVLLALEGKDSGQHATLALKSAQRALTIDPRLSTAHAVLGAAYVLTGWSWSSAGEEFGNALALNPDDSLAHLWFAMFALVPEGQYKQAENHINLALKSDPLSLIAQTDLGWVYLSEGHVDRAREQYKLVLDMDPAFVPAQFRWRQLRSNLLALHTGTPGLPQPAIQPSTRPIPAILESRLIRTNTHQDPCDQANDVLQGPESERNFEILKHGIEHHCSALLYLAQDPRLAPWQHDPRLADTLSAFHFPSR